MAEESRNEFNAIVSVLGDVLIELRVMRDENRQNSERMIETFNTGFDRMHTQLDKIGGEIEQIRTQPILSR